MFTKAVRHYGSIAVYNEARSVAWLLRQTCQKRHSDTEAEPDLSGRPSLARETINRNLVLNLQKGGAS